MENWGKRAAILIAFSFVLGILLILARGIGRSDRVPPPEPRPEKLEIASEPPAGVPEKPQTTASPSHAIPAPRTTPPAPARSTAASTAPPASESGRSHISETLSKKLNAEAERESTYRALFSSTAFEKDGKVDRKSLEAAVYDYLEQYRPQLELSERDKQHLVDLVEQFREANIRMRSAPRDQTSAPEIRQNIIKMQTAMDDFRKMTGAPPENPFGDGTPTTLFGEETTKPGEDPFEQFRTD